MKRRRKMNFQDFVVAVKENISEEIQKEVKEENGDLYGKNMVVEMHTNLKNNGKELVGITIREAGINVAPTIYLEEFYRKMEEGEEISSIIKNIIMEYKKVRFQKSWNIEEFREYDRLKERIAYKLINLEKNKKFLEDTPYMQYLDLAIVFYVIVEVTDQGSATMIVKNSNLVEWRIDILTLYQQAMINVEYLLPARFQTMTSVISEIMDINCEDVSEESMYVLSNTRRNYGAACILYPDKLKEIATYLDSDYYVLPSSVHEVIIIPEQEYLVKEEMEKMVCEVNETQVSEEEILSNKVYCYHRESERLLY